MLVRALGQVVGHYFEGREHLSPWHHAMTYARPANAGSFVYSGSTVPKSLYDCVGLAALDALVSNATYSLVRIVAAASRKREDV